MNSSLFIKKAYCVAFLLIAFLPLKAQLSLHWDCPTHLSSWDPLNMIATLVVNVDGVEITNSNIEMAAFIGETLMSDGGTFPVVSNSGRFFYYMTLNGFYTPSDENHHNRLRFKLYDHATETELDYYAPFEVIYQSNASLGSANSPMVIPFFTNPDELEWRRVDGSQLQSGDIVVIGGSESDYIMSREEGSVGGAYDIIREGNTITFIEPTIAANWYEKAPQKILIYTGASSTSNNTMMLFANSGFLYPAEVNPNADFNHAAMSFCSYGCNGDSYWSINTDGGVANIVANGDNPYRIMQFSPDDGVFSCYTEASEESVCIYRLGLYEESSDPTPLTNLGPFSVGENTCVFFSQGNLQYQASTNTWRFAENQWDYVGSDNSNISQTYSGWIDLFGWGTSGYHDSNDPYNVNYQPWSTSSANVNADYNRYGYGPSTNMVDPNLTGSSANYDWGVYNAISNGGNQVNSGWRTLTQPEWDYLFNTRGTGSGIRYAKAQVNNVNGVILLPDDWSADYYTLNSTNTSGAGYSTNVITASQWATLEQHGAVFLPAAGGRNGTSVYDVGSNGYYWSASYSYSGSAYDVDFYDGYLYTDRSNYRRCGQSVRLVRPVENCSFTIQATPSPAEGGAVSGAGTYAEGAECTLTATANEGYFFVNWTKNGEVVSTNPTYTFTVVENASFVAKFSQNNYNDAEFLTIGEDGTETNLYVPAFVYYFDDFTRSQFVIPAEDLSEMRGGSIVSMKFYTIGSNIPYTSVSEVDVYLKEVAYTSIDAFDSKENNAILYHGVLDFVVEGDGGSLTIEFDNPYLYGGGNLLVGIENTTDAGWKKITFYGKTVEGASVADRNANSLDEVSPTQRNFLPKTTFAYIPSVGSAGVLNGLFTIDESGSQVNFSQGNLQYKASTNTWRFANNQWDYVGGDNSNISQTYTGWIDLFGWGTSGYNHGANCYQPWSTSTEYRDYYAYGNYQNNLFDQTGQADWGYNAISNGGNIENIGWRTLTQPEWDYLFNTRGTGSGIRYAKAQVNNVNGVILLPDDWSADYYTLNSTNTSGANFSTNVITASQWATLEQHGAVFLPAAGYRYGTSVLVGGGGFYWSASFGNSDYAYSVYFDDGSLYTDYYGSRYFGRSVRLVRAVENYSIHATPSPAEGGAVSGAGAYMAGAECTLTATANEGYAFVNWTENGEVVSTDSTYLFTVTGDRELVANFEEVIDYYWTPQNEAFEDNMTLTGVIQIDGVEQATTALELGAFCNGECRGTVRPMYFPSTQRYVVQITIFGVNGDAIDFKLYDHDQNVELDLVSPEGVVFGTSGYGTLLNPYVLNFTQPVVEYTVNATANPSAGGTVSGAGIYQEGQSCTLTATANTGYTFVRWTKNGTQVSTNPSYTFTVTGNATYVAVFSLNSYGITVTASPAEGGTVTGVGDYSYGSTVTLTATANTGYTFVRWTKNGSQVSTNPTYSFTVTGAASYVAVFSLNSYTVSAATNPSEGGTVSGAGSYDYGASCSLTATPNTGYVFVNWTENGTTVSTSAIYSFTVSGNRTLVANFEAVQSDDHWIPQSEYYEDNMTLTGVIQIDGVEQATTALELGAFCNGECRGTVRPVFFPPTQRYVVQITIFGVNGDAIDFKLYDHDQNAELNLVSPEGVVFGPSGYGTLLNPYVLNFTQPIVEYTVTATANPSAGGTVSGAGTYQEGQSCTLTATANTGYTFVHWTLNGQVVSTEAAYTFTVTGDRELVANFELATTNHWIPVISSEDSGMSMTMVSVVRIDLVEQQVNTLEVGAFSNGVCKGSSMLEYDENLGRYITFLSIRGRNGNDITFRLYDHATGAELDLICATELTYIDNSHYGSLPEPYPIDFVTDMSGLATCTRTLDEGWNWLSFNIELDANLLEGLKSAIGEECSTAMIKTQNNGFLNYSDGIWTGTLNQVSNEIMLLICLDHEVNLNLEGVIANPLLHQVTLNPGWNWIGYVEQTRLSLSAAFANMVPEDGDMVKSLNSFSIYNASTGIWSGNLKYLEPGYGYIYQSNHSEIIEFVYPAIQGKIADGEE